MTVGEKIARLRRENGMTQESFAHATGLSRKWIASIERGRGQMSARSLARIAHVLGVRAEELKGDK